MKARSMNACAGAGLLCLLIALLCAPTGADVASAVQPSFTSNFRRFFTKYWSPWQIQESDSSNTVLMSLTQDGGAGFGSSTSYLYGKFEARIKTVPGDSAGTCFSFYLTSSGDNHDEIDLEWLGNRTGQPTFLQTNLYTNGTGGREVRHQLWFDPSADFHTYTILWNRYHIVWYVDGIPIREARDSTSLGVPYPNFRPQTISSSIYNADDWATRGGLDKIDWNAAPFTATYQGIVADACEWQGPITNTPGPVPACAQQGSGSWWDAPQYHALTDAEIGQMRWAKANYGRYDYCDDRVRYPTKSPECALSYL